MDLLIFDYKSEHDYTSKGSNFWCDSCDLCGRHRVKVAAFITICIVLKQSFICLFDAIYVNTLFWKVRIFFLKKLRTKCRIQLTQGGGGSMFYGAY
jgi:hypothetical protein